ncbi:MAG: TIGR03663 family protein [Dehalococcoidia bacterium]|nr:TIGR03663 family protein [Dehalococcoidia bacterium]
MTTDARAADYARPTPLDRALAVRLAINWELAFYIAIFAAAFALRFWDLGARALHHDESIHAQWSWRLIQGEYEHSPIFHGPLYYHVQGLFFLVFGTSDYTSRMSAAVFGLAICALPLLMRRRLGPVGTFAAVAFIALSPTLVYYSRFFREDIYMAAFTLLMVASLWRYMDEGRERWLYLFAAGFVGSVLIKEGAFLTFAVFLVYLDIHLAADLGKRMLAARGLDGDPWRRAAMTFFLAPYAWVIAPLWPLLGSVRRRFDLDGELPRSGDLLILLGTFTLPLITPALRPYFLEKFGILDEDQLKWEGWLQNQVSRENALALIGLFAITTSVAAFAGLQWKPRLWTIAFAAGAAVYLTLMTFFWTNPDGVISGPWGSLDYWIEQHDVKRGGQPWHYYLVLFPSYEFLPMVVALGGIWWSTVRGTAFSRFLWIWIVGMFFALSWGGEKMPWLNVHLTVPACVLAAWTIQRAWDGWRDRPGLHRIAMPLASVALMAAGALGVAVFLPGGTIYHLWRAIVVAGAAAVIVYAMRPYGRQAIAATVTVAAVGALAFFSVRTMVDVVYNRGDVPKDMLIYTQSSPDIPRIKSEIDALAEATGKGFDLPIAVDSADSFAWPWAWYLRDYRRVGYIDMSSGLPDGEYDVLLVNQSNSGKVSDDLAGGPGALYGSPTRYPHRWWFDESIYRSPLEEGGQAMGPLELRTWKEIGRGTFGGEWLDTWYTFWRDHDPDNIHQTIGTLRCNSCGSVDAFVYFPASFDPVTGKLSAQAAEAPKPGADSEGRLTFGGYGFQDGQFIEPIDVEADAAGNLYVIDARTRRLQKFDGQGNYLASVDIREVPGSAAEESQPWGLAVAPNGTVVVADTFGWRVRTFDPDLKPLATIGKKPVPETGQPPKDDELYGPRDVAVDAQGNYWVTDGGHDRIVVFRPDGTVVRTIGSEGAGELQFNEPVGITIAGDGTVYVADMYNARVVVLASDGAWRGSFPVQGWGGQETTDKPYIEALPDGRLAAGWPGGNQVRLYDSAGVLVGSVDGGSDPLSRPYGLQTAPDAKLWVVEGGSGRLRLFSLP